MAEEEEMGRKYRTRLEPIEEIARDVKKLEDIRQRRDIEKYRKELERELVAELHPIRTRILRAIFGVPQGVKPKPTLFQTPRAAFIETPQARVEEQMAEAPEGLSLATISRVLGEILNRLQNVEERLMRYSDRTRERATEQGEKMMGYVFPHSSVATRTEQKKERIQELTQMIQKAEMPVPYSEVESQLENITRTENVPAISTIPATPIPPVQPPMEPQMQPKEAPMPEEGPTATEASIPGFEKTLIPGLVQNPNDTITQKEIAALNQKIQNAQHEAIPEAILKNPELTPEQKYKAYTDYLQSMPKPDTTLLRAELYSLQHPIISKRIKEQGERHVLKNGKVIYVAPEDLESFYRSGLSSVASFPGRRQISGANTSSKAVAEEIRAEEAEMALEEEYGPPPEEQAEAPA